MVQNKRWAKDPLQKKIPKQPVSLRKGIQHTQRNANFNHSEMPLHTHKRLKRWTKSSDGEDMEQGEQSYIHGGRSLKIFQSEA